MIEKMRPTFAIFGVFAIRSADVWGPDQARYLDFDLDISVGKITRAPTEITRYGRYLGSDPRYLGPDKISRF